MGFWTVQKKFLPIKLHYGLFNAGTATVQPTMPVYAKVLGFTSFVVGTIYTILPIFGLIIKPAFGAIADKFKWYRGILLAWEVIVVSVYFAIWFIPPAHPEGFTNSTRMWNIKTISVCSSAQQPPHLLVEGNNCAWTCELTPKRCADWKIGDLCAPYETHLVNNNADHCVSSVNSPNSLDIGRDEGCTGGCNDFCNQDEYDEVGDTYSQWQFWLFVFLLVGAWGGTSVVTTITDTLCIEICEDPYLYGQQRLWGSMAWGLFSIINGFLIDAVSSEDAKNKNYTPAFLLMIPPLLIDLYISYKLKFKMPAQAPNLLNKVWKVILTPRMLLFNLWCVMVGISFGLVWNFLFWLLEDLACAQGSEVTSRIKTIEGLVAGFETFIGETPAFFFGGWIVNKIGHGHAMTLVFIAIGLRYSMYSILVNPWWSLPIEILQNNYGIFYSTMTSYAKHSGYSGTEASIQSILCAMCEGVGVAIGSFLGGLFYDSYGGSVTFRIFGIMFCTLAVSNELIQFLMWIMHRKDVSYMKYDFFLLKTEMSSDT